MAQSKVTACAATTHDDSPLRMDLLSATTVKRHAPMVAGAPHRKKAYSLLHRNKTPWSSSSALLDE
jgi:hypothetical protein